MLICVLNLFVCLYKFMYFPNLQQSLRCIYCLLRLVFYKATVVLRCSHHWWWCHFLTISRSINCSGVLIQRFIHSRVYLMRPFDGRWIYGGHEFKKLGLKTQTTIVYVCFRFLYTSLQPLSQLVVMDILYK